MKKLGSKTYMCLLVNLDYHSAFFELLCDPQFLLGLRPVSFEVRLQLPSYGWMEGWIYWSTKCRVDDSV